MFKGFQDADKLKYEESVVLCLHVMSTILIKYFYPRANTQEKIISLKRSACYSNLKNTKLQSLLLTISNNDDSEDMSFPTSAIFTFFFFF